MHTNANLAPISAADPWAGDLFGRKAEAQLLIDYIQSVGGRVNLREDHAGFTIAVDADYGIGKSYFLRRLAIDLAEHHPVAFIDAWSDDLADEPLTAIAATLKKALAPLISKSSQISNKWDIVAKKTGAVAKIAALGLIKKGLGVLITSPAADAVEGVIKELAQTDAELVADAIKDAGKDVASDTIDELSKKSAKALMDERIAAFENGQQAIIELKRSLVDLVAALSSQGKRAPIVIIIDELDRCRPTYAVKLLEELKHLFDIPGLVFILGMHANQLSHSVAGAYGPGFEGEAYLRRFINRQYKLSYPDMSPLISHLMNQYGIERSKLRFLPVRDSNNYVDNDPDASIMIARYMKDYGMTARSVFSVMDLIQTSVAISNNSLFLPYLLPMILNKSSGRNVHNDIPLASYRGWTYVLHGGRFDDEPQVYPPEQVFKEMSKYARWSFRQVREASNGGDLLANIAEGVWGGQQSISSLPRYPDLMEAVGRFSNPTVDIPEVDPST